MNTDDLNRAEEIAKAAIPHVRNIHYQACFHPEFCLSLINEVRRLSKDEKIHLEMSNEIYKLTSQLTAANEIIKLYDGIAGNNCNGVSQFSAASVYLAKLESGGSNG